MGPAAGVASWLWARGAEVAGHDVEIVAASKVVGQMGPYERLRRHHEGDATLLRPRTWWSPNKSEWWDVDTILNHNISVHEYEPGTWGPAESESGSSSHLINWSEDGSSLE